MSAGLKVEGFTESMVGFCRHNGIHKVWVQFDGVEEAILMECGVALEFARQLQECALAAREADGGGGVQ